MRILFLTKRFYTNRDLIGDRYGRLFHLPVELSRMGHSVEVVALDYRSSQTGRDELDGVVFHSVGIRHPKALGTLLEVRRLTRNFLPDVVVASADTPIGWLGSRLAHLTGAAFVFDIYDNYAAFASGRVPGVRSLFDKVQSTADAVVVVSERLREMVASRCASVHVIPNGVDEAVFHPVPRSIARRDSGIPEDRFVVGYFGSMEPERGIEVMIAAVDTLDEQGLAPLLLTAGFDKLGLRPTSASFEHRGLVPQSEVALLINACDVVVLPYLATDWGEYTYPNKIAEYTACGVPIVATNVACFPDALRDTPHVVCEPGIAPLMAMALASAAQLPRASSPGHATWTSLAGRFQAVLESVGADPASS